MRVFLIPFLLTLAACDPQPPLEEIGGGPGTAIPRGPIDYDAPVEGALVERAPDLCSREEYQLYVGQDADVLQTLVIEREFRVIAPGDIVTQEYNASRLNFRLGRGNRIADVDCG